MPALLVGVLVVTLAACDALDRLPEEGSSQPQAQDQQGSQDTDGGAQTPPADTPGSRERDAQDGAGDGDRSLGSTTGQHPNHAEDAMVPLQLDVTGLQRKGDLVELKMLLTVATDQPDVQFSPWDFMADTKRANYGYDISGVRLVSQSENKAYLPAIDSDDVCLCSAGLDNVMLGAGESTSLSATFGGIPAEVTDIDLHMPGFSPLAGLTIQS